MLSSIISALLFLQSYSFLVSFYGQDGVGFDYNTGFTFDGHMLDYTSGDLAPGGLHNFSAPSKESLHIGMLTLCLSGDPNARLFVGAVNDTDSTRGGAKAREPHSSDPITDRALDILERKITTYETFAKELPGFGG